MVGRFVMQYLTVISKKGHRTTKSRSTQKLISFETSRETEVQDKVTENKTIEKENKVDKSEISGHGELVSMRLKWNAARPRMEFRQLRHICG